MVLDSAKVDQMPSEPQAREKDRAVAEAYAGRDNAIAEGYSDKTAKIPVSPITLLEPRMVGGYSVYHHNTPEENSAGRIPQFSVNLDATVGEFYILVDWLSIGYRGK